MGACLHPPKHGAAPLGSLSTSPKFVDFGHTENWYASLLSRRDDNGKLRPWMATEGAPEGILGSAHIASLEV